MKSKFISWMLRQENKIQYAGLLCIYTSIFLDRPVNLYFLFAGLAIGMLSCYLMMIDMKRMMKQMREETEELFKNMNE